ncbi:unnamed protein product [Parnassius mnemosyne]|uniref:Reverse transcriptase domain-containing protein n=1 Tax=Parnassius mnemosyne TaxID=213953 RepID=A0AAV1LYD2_9NEOP
MEGLIKVQADLKQKISSGYSNFRKSPKARITKPYVETRLEQLEKQWSQFETNHYNIISEADTDKKETLCIKQNVYDSVEESYVAYKVELKEALTDLLAVTQSTSSNVTMEAEPPAMRLPKIVFPSFSGQYMEWQTFHDLFESLIHNNSSLADVQKLHYLKGHLTGEAEQLLRHIPITDANYETCWLQLKKRYSNKRYIANRILTRLMGQRSLTLESASGIKQILDTTNDCLNALSNLGIDVLKWDIIVIHLIALKLNPETRKQWEQRISEYTDEFPSYSEFQKFLESRFRALEFLEPNKNDTKSKERVEKHKVFKVTTVTCQFCSESHLLHQCKKFCKESYGNRYEFVRKHRLCFNCFGDSHPVYRCKRSTKCNRCGRRHHSLLHPEGGVGSPLNIVSNPTETHQDKKIEQPSADVGQVISNHCYVPGRVILATAVVRVFSSKNKCYLLRALLDQGSQTSFITEHCAQLLGLRKSSVKGVVTGLGGEISHSIKHAVQFKIQSTICAKFECEVRAYVLNQPSSNLPVRRVDIHNWSELSKLRLADPGFGTPNKIDILLGAEVYAQILTNGLVKNPSGALTAQNTELGWILSGRVQLEEEYPSNIISLHIDDSLNQLIRSFWEIENEQPQKILSEEDKRCESLYDTTTTRTPDGRYIVRLPFREEDPQCQYGALRDIAMRRFNLLENRLNKNPLLKEEYSKAMSDYINQGHMRVVYSKELAQTDCVYLPHHAVVREDKTTTKVRIVFDASCKGKNGRSLNDDLLVGPRLQPELRHILLRWRAHPVCFVADIKQMYRQVRVDEKDASKYQRLLWRPSQNKEVKVFMMTRVTFGVSSAPYLAVKSLQQVAKDEGQNYELAACRVLNDFYMDDFMSGCENESQAVEIYKQVSELLAKGGFGLQKWASNSSKLMEMVQDKGKEKKLNTKLDDIVKILGLCWDVTLDAFRYKVNLPEQKQRVTKRTILSDIARLFDPLGWTAPVIIRAKIYMQKLWLAGVSWDEEITGNLLQEWITFRQDLPVLNHVIISRWTHMSESVVDVSIHGFCDASNDAYAAVVYLRIVDSLGGIHVSLCAARTKVAPLKQISTPRLELSGAELLAGLLSEIALVMGLSRSQIRAWTDSTIVLAWLKGEPSRWKTFVANRVTKILTVLDNEQWSHVESAQNPADCASRGLSPSDFIKHDLWRYGPNWLRDLQYPQSQMVVPQTNLEERSIKIHTVIEDSPRLPTDITVWNKY